MKTLLKEYIKHIIAETLKEQLFRKTKPQSMFANYQSGGGGGGGGGGGLHASQKFEFKRPIRAGDVLTVKAKPGNTWEKEGKKGGKLLFSEHIQEFFDQKGELVVTVTMVGVQTSKVVTEG